jgi:hypothetical protein
MMKTLHKISFSLLLFMFVTFILGQDIVRGPLYEKAKIENSATAASFPGCNSESANEEDVTFFLQSFSGQILAVVCQKLSLPAFGLPPAVSYPIWLPPDNS